MKLAALTLLIILVAACSPSAARQQEQAMDEVERAIQLPDGASALSSYARFYTRADDGKILGAFMVPQNWMLADKSFPRPGERRWVSGGTLPIQMDGGCTFIRFEYDPKSNRFDGPKCNGTA